MVKKMMAMKGIPLQSTIKEDEEPEKEGRGNGKEGGITPKEANVKEGGVIINGNGYGGPQITVNGGDGLPDLKVGQVRLYRRSKA